MPSIVTFNIQYEPAVIYEGDFDVHNTLVITALTDNCNIYLKRNNTPSTSSFEDKPINIVYSLDDGASWLELNLESQEFPYEVNLGTLISGKSIYIRGNNFGRSTLYGLNICTDKSASVSGKIMSLLYKKSPSTTFPQYNTYGAFQRIFYESKITDASQLSLPTTLEDYCYEDMFDSCTSLTTAPALPATTLADGCYRCMFNGCTSLTTAPELPATTLADYCYIYMFAGCTSLTTAPALPATTLEEYCYYGMFQGCTSLTTAPALPATTLEEYCYYCMFQGCSSLTTAPELPATTLEEYCYQGMFKGCSSLTAAPILPAPTLVTGCYANMFENCTSLNYIYICSNMQIGIPYTTNWVKNVSQRGTFAGAGDIDYTEIGVNGIPTTWVYKKDYYGKYFTIESLEDNNKIYCLINIPDGYDAPDITLYYSLDNGATWTTLNPTDGWQNPVSFVTINTGDTLIIKGNNDALCGPMPSNTYFKASNNHIVYGNIMSLLNGDNFRTNSSFVSGSVRNFQSLFYRNDKLIDASNLILPATTLTAACYNDMFWGCTSLTTAPELPATTLAKGCYVEMFAYCSSLTTAPELPVTTLAEECYVGMFENCTSLTTAPALPATTLVGNCYQSMFENCTSLTTAPELPATTLTDLCYSHMFNGCTSLTTAPELPATTLTSNCYAYMFSGCTSLTTAPELPATTLAGGCYNRMFENCTSLTTAPELPATTLVLSCYSYMFYGCTKLNYIKAMFTTTPSTSYTNNWVNGVASSGTFVRNDEATWKSIGNNGIPTGWTIYPRYDCTQDYITIESLADNNRILWKLNGDMDAKTIEWSTDKTIWTSITASTSTLITTLNNGDKVYIKGNNANYGATWGKYNYFSSDGNFNVYGNIMSLIYGDNFIGNNTLSGECNFYFMFYNSKVIDASNLILPNACQAHTYSNMFHGCTSLVSAPLMQQTTTAYQSNVNMFDGCTSLTTAPVLRASNIDAYSYNNMFNGCTSLNSVTTYAENLGTWDHGFDNWLLNVSPTGTFTKKASMTLFPEGASGIPSGWTVQNI